MPVVLASSLTALAVVAFGAPTALAMVLVGAFMLFAPGLVLVELLQVDDGLLTLVLGSMVGPVLWVVLPTIELFLGAWHPDATVFLVAALLAGVATYRLVGARRSSLRPRPLPAKL